jgi:hypothetical protein
MTSAASAGGTQAVGTSSQRQIPRKAIVALYIFVGLMLIIGVPISFYSYPVINYDVIGVAVAFGLIIILVALWDWMGAKSMKRSLAPYVILILSIVSILLFSHTFDTPWIGTYHLYIIPIDIGGASNMWLIPSSKGEYAVQNMVAAISEFGGIMMLLASLYEISIVRKLPK